MYCIKLTQPKHLASWVQVRTQHQSPSAAGLSSSGQALPKGGGAHGPCSSSLRAHVVSSPRRKKLSLLILYKNVRRMLFYLPPRFVISLHLY